MSSNPYAPPLAKVEDTPDRRDTGTPQFFQVAPWKLVLMTAATIGFYQLYWSYQHWRILRARDRSDIWPVPRAIFGVLFGYSLFSRIRLDGQARHLSGPPAAGPLAALWISANIAWRLPGALAIIGVVAWFVVIPIQAYANRINAQAAPGAPLNNRLTWINWIGVVVGVPFQILVLVSLVVPVGQ